MSKRLILLGSVIIVIIAGWIVYPFLQTRKPHNLVLFTLDTTRTDHLSVYGYRLKTTPNIDRIASEGIRFQEVYAPMPSTEPSHSTMFTSKFPISHGVLKNGFTLSDQNVTMAEVLKQHGYQTAAVISSFPLNHKFGFSQGFDFYNDRLKGKNPSLTRKHWMGADVNGQFDRRADSTTNQALKWLKEKRDPTKPFFLWVHYFDPHGPYDPPEPYRSKYKVAGSVLDQMLSYYDGEIEFMDSQLARLVEYLDSNKLRDNTLLVIVGDHGEGLMQHGRLEHGLLIYDEAVLVPLIFRMPSAISSGKAIQGPVSLVDLMPTVLHLMKIPVANLTFQGKDLAPLIEGGADPDFGRSIFLQRRLYETGAIEDNFVIHGLKFGIRSGRWKYIEALEEGTKELYDLQNDPGELHNIYDANVQVADQLATSLHSWEHQYATAGPNQQISKEDQERLNALGYIQ
jgi:arylsulfatase A-like enzyme